MKLTKVEKETHISFNDEDNIAYIYTCNKPLMRKLDEYCTKSTEFILKKQDDWSKWYIVPKKCISVRFPMKISDDLRAKKALAGRKLSTYREANKNY